MEKENKNLAKLKFQKNPRWNILLENEKLFITKGSDEIYLVDDLDSEKSKLIFEAYRKNKIDDLQSEEGFEATIKKLEKAGVIYKSVATLNPSNKNISIEINWFGDENAEIQELLNQFIERSNNIAIAKNKGSSDFLLLIRSSNKMVDLLENYGEIKVPHLFVDLAYDHTVSIGPLVFPGETACLSCFVGRIIRNWGDPPPPEISNASDSAELIAAFIFECVKTFQKTGSCPELIEQVWSFNLRDFSSKYDKIFKLPWCPICFPEKTKEGTGSFELHWRTSKKQLK